jgi:phosphohistidine phosphatase
VALQLLVLRHGHAKHDFPAGGDFARTLRSKGKRAVAALAPTVAELAPDLVLSSPSQRTRETVECLELSAPVVYLDILYGADEDQLLDALRDLATSAARDEPPQTVLLVGHNPGLHGLVLELTEGDPIPGFPPSALAVLALDIDDWQAVGFGTGRLVSLYLPAEPPD